MKRINKTESAEVYAGDWRARWFKQMVKCAGGSDRACRRADSIRKRHIR